MPSSSKRIRLPLMLAAFALLGGCNQAHRHDSAEREFNAWANQVEQENANGQDDASRDLEEPANVLERVAPANAH